MKNNILALSITFVLGVLFAVAIYQAVTIYKLRTLVNNDHVTLTQVVNFLNAQIQASQNNTKGGQPVNNTSSQDANVLYQ